MSPKEEKKMKVIIGLANGTSDVYLIPIGDTSKFAAKIKEDAKAANDLAKKRKNPVEIGVQDFSLVIIPLDTLMELIGDNTELEGFLSGLDLPSPASPASVVSTFSIEDVAWKKILNSSKSLGDCQYLISANCTRKPYITWEGTYEDEEFETFETYLFDVEPFLEKLLAWDGTKMLPLD